MSRGGWGFNPPTPLKKEGGFNPTPSLTFGPIQNIEGFSPGRSPTPSFCYDRSVLGFSFACGLRPHAKLNPRTPLAYVFTGTPSYC